MNDPTPPPHDPSWPEPVMPPPGDVAPTPRPPGDAPPDDPSEPRYEGYQPRQPARAAQRSTERPRTPRAPARRRRSANTRAIALAVAALVLGIVIGWMARGGPPKAELLTTNQPVPAVTITKEVTP